MMEAGKISISMLKILLITYILTGLILLGMSFLMYFVGLPDPVISVGITLIYIIANLVGGLMAGKCVESQKFIFGILMGTAYFLLLFLLSVLFNGTMPDFDRHFVTAMILCMGSGMLGGMLSSGMER